MEARQALLFDADRESQHDDDSESNSDTIEMSGLEEVPVTPARRSRYDGSNYHSDPPDSDDDSDVEDGEALLGPRSRTRGRERSEERPANTFSQVKRIVLEVSHSAYALSIQYMTAIQTGPTLLLTIVGILFTGEILEKVSVSDIVPPSVPTYVLTDMQHWKAMTRIDELIMIIPVILNLKGNLEMNLSARLGTSANMGDLDIPAKRRSIVLGNLTFLQVQATVVSFFAACVAFLMSKVLPGEASTNGEGSLNGAEGELVMRFIARGVHKPKPQRPIPPPPSGAAE